MKGSKNDIVRTAIAKALSDLAPDRMIDQTVLNDQQDLLEFVDSFGFIQLLMAIEEPLEIELDLTSIDIGTIVRFDDLVAFILHSSSDFKLSDLAATR